MSDDDQGTTGKLVAELAAHAPGATPRELAEAAWLVARWYRTASEAEVGPEPDGEAKPPQTPVGDEPKRPTEPRDHNHLRLERPNIGIADANGTERFALRSIRVHEAPLVIDQRGHARGLARVAARAPKGDGVDIDLERSIALSAEVGHRSARRIALRRRISPTSRLLVLVDIAPSLAPWARDVTVFRRLARGAHGYLDIEVLDVDLSSTPATCRLKGTSEPTRIDLRRFRGGPPVTCVLWTDGLGPGFLALAGILREQLPAASRIAWMHPWPSFAWRRTPAGTLKRTRAGGPQSDENGVPVLIIPFDTRARYSGVTGWSALERWTQRGRPNGWPVLRLPLHPPAMRAREDDWTTRHDALQGRVADDSLRILGLAAALPTRTCSVDLLRALAHAAGLEDNAFHVAEVLTSGFLRRSDEGIAFVDEEARQVAVGALRGQDFENVLRGVGAQQGIPTDTLDACADAAYRGTLWDPRGAAAAAAAAAVGAGPSGVQPEAPPLHPHQREAIDALAPRLDAGTSCILRMPPGSGKTRIAFELVRHLLKRQREARVLWITHGQSEARASHDAFRQWDSNFGVLACMLRHRARRLANVFFAAASELSKQWDTLAGTPLARPDLVVWEAPPRFADANVRHLKPLLDVGATILATTAPPLESIGALGSAHEHVVDVTTIVRSGFWHLPTLTRVQTDANYSSGHAKHDDFSAHTLNELGRHPSRVADMAAFLKRESAGNGPFIVHACGDAHAQQLRDHLLRSGVNALWVQEVERTRSRGHEDGHDSTTVDVWINSDPDTTIAIAGVRTVVLTRPTYRHDRFYRMLLPALRTPGGQIVSLVDAAVDKRACTDAELERLGAGVASPKSFAQLKPGARLPPFIVRECLDGSATTTTWRVTDERDARQCRLTVLDAWMHAEHADRAERAWRVYASAANRAGVPGKVSLHLWPRPSRPMAGLEWPALPVFGDALRAGKGEPLGWEACIRFASTLLEALTVLHTAGVAHRDIRVDNVFEVHDRDGVPAYFLGPPGVGLSLAEMKEPAPEVAKLRNRSVHEQFTPSQLDDRDSNGLPADVWAVGRLVSQQMRLQGGRGDSLAAQIEAWWCADAPASRPTAQQASAWLGTLRLDEPEDPAARTHYDPVTTLPWYACPACQSPHTRAHMIARLRERRMTEVVPRRDQDGLDVVDDLRLVTESIEPLGLAPGATFLACGACSHLWRPDGEPFGDEGWAQGMRGPWNWTDFTDGDAAVRRVLAEAGEEPESGRVTGLADLDLSPDLIGQEFTYDIDLLVTRTSFWFDEANEDGRTGLHLHPANLLDDRSSYMRRFAPMPARDRWRDDEVWGDTDLGDGRIAGAFVHVDPEPTRAQRESWARVVLTAIRADDLSPRSLSSSGFRLPPRAWARLLLHASRTHWSGACFARMRKHLEKP